MADLKDVVIGTIDAAGLLRLIAAGEPGGVERKAMIPSNGLGPSAAAFANSEGGWILLGVRDDGSIEGWEPPGTAQIHDHLREHLRRAVDPLPPFDSQLLDTADGSVGIIRIPASPVRPHITKETGVIYEREPGGKRPIDSQAKVLAMATRPEQARADAVHRLTQLPMVAEALDRTLTGPAANGQTRTIDWIVAATPLAVPPRFANVVIGGDHVRAIEQVHGNAIAVLTEQSTQQHATTTAQPRGLRIDGGDQATRHVTQLTLDAGGVVVARWSGRLFRGPEHLPGLVNGNLAPLLTLSLDVLGECGVVGAVLVHGYIRIRPTNPSWSAVLDVFAADQSGQLTADHAQPIRLGAEIDLPADAADRREQVDSWTAELGRGAGLPMWG